MIKVGCCGYSYFRPEEYYGKEWKKKYTSILAAYSSKFDLVEINSTFYRIPQIKTVEKWFKEALSVNKNFEFTVKVFQGITHGLFMQNKKEKPFSSTALSFYKKIYEICKVLHAKYLLFQSPSSFKPTEENIDAMRRFFNDIDRNDHTFVWEPRGEWWKNLSLIKEVCKELNLLCCVDPLRNNYPWQKTAYFRLHGFGKPTMYNYKFSKEEMKRVKEIASEFKEAYVLFNNVYMYEQAIEFKEMID